MNPLVKDFPHLPGCYLMKNKQGEVIYVGKAKDLKKRVTSYFAKEQTGKTAFLLKEIEVIDYVIVNSESEAFLLELNLIQKYLPKYNILLTDDKKYPYIVLTNDKYPRLIYTRDKKLGKAFGPFPSSSATKEIVRLLNSNFKLVKCRKIPKTACLYYHIGSCFAPCINEVSKDDYQKVVNKVEKILKGDTKDIKKELETKLKEEAKNLLFEKAIETKKLINYLDVITEKQIIEKDLKELDAFSFYTDDDYLSVEVLFYRNEKLIGGSNFMFKKNTDVLNDLMFFVLSFYFKFNNPIPKLILVEDGDTNILEELLKTKVIIPQKGKKKEIIKLGKMNAKENYERKTLEKRQTEENVKILKDILGLKKLERIDVIDNSHLQGSYLVSGVIVFENGAFNKHKYRKYQIKSFTGIDDVRAMKEVIERRYQNDDCDLLLVDGKVQQVNGALEAFQELGKTIRVAGLYKDDKHTTKGLYYDHKELEILKTSSLYLFLKKLQDEVHNFAINYYKLKSRKGLLKTELEKIRGIGKITLEKILKALKEGREGLDKLKLPEHLKEEVLKVLNNDD